jgi:hypothetical protein
LQEKNFDFERLILTIEHHDSEGVLESGRKSDSLKRKKERFTTPISSFILQELAQLDLTGDPEAFLFSSEKNPTTYMSYSTFNNRWIAARKKAALELGDLGLSSVPLYTAAKHAGVVRLIDMGTSFEKIMRITGITREALEHYARMRAQSVLSDVENLARFRFQMATKANGTSKVTA